MKPSEVIGNLEVGIQNKIPYIKKAFSALSEKEQRVISLKHGLIKDKDPINYKEISKEIKSSEYMTRVIYDTACLNFRNNLYFFYLNEKLFPHIIPPEKKMLQMRLGFNDENLPHTYKEIADYYGISEKSVLNTLDKIFKKGDQLKVGDVLDDLLFDTVR